MKKYIPAYYKEFQCIAGKCKDNCCIGWDIMIDEQSYDRYRKVKTPFKKRLDEGICHEKQPQFYLDDHKRCVFLNQDNLCDIYIQLGEDALCEICTEHPRYHNEYGHIKQSGLGLACEEAARLILKGSNVCINEIQISEEAEEPDEWAEELMQIELQLLEILQRKEYPIEDRINYIYDLTAMYQEQFNLTGELSVQLEKKEIQQYHILKKMEQQDYLEYWFEFYDTLDYMDEEFRTLLQKARDDKELFEYHNTDQYIERLISYFIYRYFMKSYEDDNFIDKIKFAILSTLLIVCIDRYCQKYDISFEFLQIAKMYSKEIEYSEENMQSIYEELLFD